MEIIKVNHLKKYYGSVKAVDDITFSVNKGELFGFLGINGAGKSTTINMLSTLLSQTGGSAEICGMSIDKNQNDIRRKIGIVYQHNCLDNILTVQENLMSRGLFYGQSKAVTQKQFDILCDILSVGSIAKKRYGTLSGGQKRRCEIAAALMHTPEILFLDEPTTGLDPATRKDVWNAVEDLRTNTEMTVFLTTHYMEEAAAANNIVIIDKGKICAEGTPFELKDKYANDTLRLFAENPNEIKSALDRLENVKPKYTVTDLSVNVSIKHTMDALPIISQLSGMVSGFEVIQGDMDDVFLNATGQVAL